jgi:hypothetical protein
MDKRLDVLMDELMYLFLVDFQENRTYEGIIIFLFRYTSTSSQGFTGHLKFFWASHMT